MQEHGTIGASRRRRAAPRGSAAALALAAVSAACATYEPRPLDAVAHREAWQARGLDGNALRHLLARLDGTVETTPDFDATDGLTLDEGRLVALVHHPRLRLARLRADRAADAVALAGVWNDPELSLGLLRVTDDVPNPWVITPGLAFTIPISGRLEAEEELAGARLEASERGVLEAEWDVWLRVRDAWIEWSAARGRLAEIERQAATLAELVATAASLAAQGELPLEEASLFALAGARQENRVFAARVEATQAERRVRAAVGLAPSAPVALVPAPLPGAVDAPPVSADEAIERNPALARLRAEYEVAEAVLRREVRAQVPDLVLGPAFERDQGRTSLGLFGTIAIPVLDGNRRRIAEARADREIARAAFELEVEDLVARWAASGERLAALAAQREHLEGIVAPLAEDLVRDARRLLELGEASPLVLLEGLARAHATRLDVIDLRAREAVERAERERLAGPTPRSAEHEAPQETP